jgi:hypothetical protein
MMAGLASHRTRPMFHAHSRSAQPCALSIVLLVLVLLAGCSQPGTDSAFGLELHKPSGWTYISGDGSSAARGDTIDYSSTQVAQAIASHGAAPLFALLKRPPPQAGINPTFGINLTRDAANRGQSCVALLATVLARASASGQFHIVQAATASTLAAHPGAQAELRTAAPAADGSVTRVRLYLLVIDDVAVLMAATDAVSGADEASGEFTQILASLRLPGAP